MKTTFKLTLLLFYCSACVFAQQGKIAGKVIDGAFNDVLPFANILVKGTTKGATSDFDGNYVINLDSGTYTLVFSYVGYETKEISNIVVQPNQVTDVEVILNENSNNLDTAIITTTVKRNTESSVLNLQKKSTTLLDGLSAQSIKKSGAGDAAAVIKSIPGVSLQGSKYVYVRGLGDRYTKSILNGIDIPGLDPDRNTVQMDIFPTNIIDNIIVIKSAASEYPADFTGGVIDIVTKDFSTKAEYSISVGASYNKEMHLKDGFLKYDGSSSDFLGYDNGKRNLPIHRYQPIPGTFENKLLLTTLTSQFDPILAAKQANSGFNFNFGFTAGNQYELSNNTRIGYLASASYKNETIFYENRIDGNYIKNQNDPTQFNLQSTRFTQGEEGINSIILNGLAGITLKTRYSKYKATILHVQNGESSAAIFNQAIAQAGGGTGFENVKKDALLYTERSITNTLLSGEHLLTEGGLEFNWKFSPTFTKVLDKDHRITTFEQSQEGEFRISPSTANFPVRIWRSLQEESWDTKVNLSDKYVLFSHPAKVKFGASYTFKYRDFSTDQYLFTSTDFRVPNGDANFLLRPENIWTPETKSGTFLNFGQAFQAANAYEGKQNIAATYLSNEFQVSKYLKAILGIRTEMYRLFYTGQNQSGTEIFNGDLILNEFDFFPSVNLISALSNNSNLRASYSITTARPSFKEASNIQIFDPVTNRTFIGNGFGNDDYDAIVPTYISNYDLRYEWFREGSQMFAVSGFYKDFTDPIEQVFFPATAEQFTVANLGNARVYGAEIEMRQNLGFITHGLKNLKLNVNYSIIKSEVEMSDTEFNRRQFAARQGETIKRMRALQGQSPYLINAGLDYSNSEIGLQTSLSYNVQGKALEVVGTGIVPDVYTQPFHSLNATFNKEFGYKRNSIINLKVTNILGSERKSEYESFGTTNETFSLRNPGTEISLGYTIKF